MDVVLTGASGFVGQHLLRALRRTPGMSVAPLVGDVRDPGTYASAARADIVYHLAAMPQTVRDPVTAWEVNATGTLRVLEWMRGTRGGRLVLVSSSHVYGKPRVTRIDEQHTTEPVAPYGATKLAAEALARAYSASYGIETVIVRPFNMYGPAQSRGFLVPDILHQLREGGSLVLGNPEPVRDFTYIDDAIEFLVRCAAARAAAGEAFNLGSGSGHSVREVVETAIRVSGADVEPFYDPARYRPADVAELVVDNAKARRLLDWAPRVGLEEGLRRTWESMGGNTS